MKSSENPKVSSEVVFRDVQGEGVLLDLKTGTYFGFDETGTEIWKMLAEKKAVSEIAAFLSSEYAVSEEKAAADVSRFISDLRKKKLLL